MSFFFMDSCAHYHGNKSKYNFVGGTAVPLTPCQAGAGRGNGALVWNDSGWGAALPVNLYTPLVPLDGHYVGTITGVRLNLSLSPGDPAAHIITIDRMNAPGFDTRTNQIAITADGSIEFWSIDLSSYPIEWKRISRTAPGVFTMSTLHTLEYGYGQFFNGVVPLEQYGTVIMLDGVQVIGTCRGDGDFYWPTLGPYDQIPGTFTGLHLEICDVYFKASSDWQYTVYPYSFQGNWQVNYYPVSSRYDAEHLFNVWRDGHSSGTALVPELDGLGDPNPGSYVSFGGDPVYNFSNMNFLAGAAISEDPSMIQIIMAWRGDEMDLTAGENYVVPTTNALGIDWGLDPFTGLGTLHQYYIENGRGNFGPLYGIAIAPSAALCGSRLPDEGNPIRNLFNGVGWIDSGGTRRDALYGVSPTQMVGGYVVNDPRVYQLGVELFLPGTPGPVTLECGESSQGLYSIG